MSVADRRALVADAMREAEALQGTPRAARPLPHMLPRLSPAARPVSATQPTSLSAGTISAHATLADSEAQQRASVESNGAAVIRSDARQPAVTSSGDAAAARSAKQVAATAKSSGSKEGRSGAQQSAHGAAEASTSQGGAPASPSRQSPRVRGASNLKNLVSGNGTNSGTTSGGLHAPTEASAVARPGGDLRAGTGSGGQSRQGPVSLTSQRYSGIGFMTPDGDTSAARLREADLSAALADSWQPGSPATLPAQPMSAAKDRDNALISSVENATEDKDMMHALVGEDEEFSTGTGQSDYSNITAKSLYNIVPSYFHAYLHCHSR